MIQAVVISMFSSMNKSGIYFQLPIANNPLTWKDNRKISTRPCIHKNIFLYTFGLDFSQYIFLIRLRVNTTHETIDYNNNK